MRFLVFGDAHDSDNEVAIPARQVPAHLCVTETYVLQGKPRGTFCFRPRRRTSHSTQIYKQLVVVAAITAAHVLEVAVIGVVIGIAVTGRWIFGCRAATSNDVANRLAPLVKFSHACSPPRYPYTHAMHVTCKVREAYVDDDTLARERDGRHRHVSAWRYRLSPASDSHVARSATSVHHQPERWNILGAAKSRCTNAILST